MLVLAETAIGFVVFKLSSDAKVDSKELWKEFESPELANKALVSHPLPHLPNPHKSDVSMCRLKVQAIQRFTSTATAVEDLTAIQDGRLTDSLSKFLVDAMGQGGDTDGEKKKKKKKMEEMLVVSDPKLGELVQAFPLQS
jgi:nucleolar protein 58